MSDASPVAETTTPVRELTPKSEDSGLVWVCDGRPATEGARTRMPARTKAVVRMGEGYLSPRGFGRPALECRLRRTHQ